MGVRALNLVDAIEEKLGFKLIVKYARYHIDGWYFQDKSPVDCSTCGATCSIFRCPYTTSKGEYRYWAVVCGGCENALTLDDIPETNKKILQKWDSKTASSKAKSTSQPDSPSAFGMLLKGVILKTYGVEIEIQEPRFNTDGWAEQEFCPVFCDDCNSRYVIYRKPFVFFGKIQKYWAVVCLTCKKCKSPYEIPRHIVKLLNNWQKSRDCENIDVLSDSNEIRFIVELIRDFGFQVQIEEFGNGSCLICTDNDASSWYLTIFASQFHSITFSLIFSTEFEPMETCNEFNVRNRTAKSYRINYDNHNFDRYFVAIEMDCDFEAKCSGKFISATIGRWVNVVKIGTNFFERPFVNEPAVDRTDDSNDYDDYDDYDPYEYDEITDFRSEETWTEIWDVRTDNYGFTSYEDDEEDPSDLY